VSHPANDLAPEPVVVFVLDPSSPAPCRITSKVERFSRSRIANGQGGHSSPIVSEIGMNGQYFRSGPALLDDGGPVKAGKSFPKLPIRFPCASQVSEPMFLSAGRQLQIGWIRRAQTGGFFRIVDNGEQFRDGRVAESQLPASPAGEEYKAGSLQANEFGKVLTLLFIQFVFSQPDVPEEDDVKGGEFILGLREPGQVSLSFAGRKARVKKNAFHINSGIPIQGIPQETVFPTGEGVDDKGLDHFVLDPGFEYPLVVPGQTFIGYLAEHKFQFVFSLARRKPGHAAAGDLFGRITFSPRDQNGLLGNQLFVCKELERTCLALLEGVGDPVINGNFLVLESEGRGKGIFDGQIGQGFLGPDLNAVDGDGGSPAFPGKGKNGRSAIGIAVRKKEYGLQVACIVEGFLEGQGKIRGLRAFIGRKSFYADG
jgi:hypothetical protein